MKTEDLIKAMQQSAGVASNPVLVKAGSWGEVYVKPQTVEEIDNEADDQKAMNIKDGKKRRLARAAAKIICDKEGKRLLDPDKEEHIALLEKQPWNLLQKVLSAVDGDPK